MDRPKIIGITRIRNEQDVILNTLNHVAWLVDDVIIMDDASTDDTVSLCKQHPMVLRILENKVWGEGPAARQEAEGNLRDLAYQDALKENPDWIYYFDADEYADFEGIDFSDKNVDVYSLRLFDFYITKHDVDTPYLQRQWMGPEYRDIPMLFRPLPGLKFYDRIPRIPKPFTTKHAGFVKHYGKAMTVEDWEKTCDYYIKHRGGDLYTKFTEKWKTRKGHAIHTKSDFGGELIKWEDRKSSKVFPLKD